MGKVHNHKIAAPSKLGKGKVTPIQIEYLVERYLSDNKYAQTLSSFRAESHLLSKTNIRPAPKGLLTLDEIINDYITLKEKKVTTDMEKRKMESFVQGIQDSLRIYQSTDATPSTSTPATVLHHPPSHPQRQPICAVSPLPVPNPTHTSSAVTLHSLARLPLVPSNAAGTTATPNHMTRQQGTTSGIHSSRSLAQNYEQGQRSSNAPSRGKKRYQKPTPVVPAPKKRLCTEQLSDASTIGGIRLPSQISATCESDVLTSAKSSVQKSLFKQTPESQVTLASSSPKTPTQSCPSSPSYKSVSPGQSPHHSPCTTTTTNTDKDKSSNNGNIPQQMTPSRCSMVSSKKVIVISPTFKKAGYYFVERSHQVSTSPLKSSSNQPGKREHVKSRLDFDSAEEIQPGSSNYSVKNEKKEEEDYVFDVDFLESIGDISFSQVLDFLDSGMDDLSSFSGSSNLEDFASSRSTACENGFLLTNQQVSSNLQSIADAVPESIESITTVTKSVQIVSPVKSRSTYSNNKLDLQ